MCFYLGDIAFRFLKYVHTLRNKNMAPGTHVTVCDINDRMLKVGEERAYKEGLVSGTKYVSQAAYCVSYSSTCVSS